MDQSFDYSLKSLLSLINEEIDKAQKLKTINPNKITAVKGLDKWWGCYLYTDTHNKQEGKVKFGKMSGYGEFSSGKSPRISTPAWEKGASFILIDDTNFKAQSNEEALQFESYIKHNKMKHLRSPNSEWYKVGFLKNGELDISAFYKYYNEFMKLENKFSAKSLAIKMTGEEGDKLNAALKVIPTFMYYTLPPHKRITSFADLKKLVEENKKKWNALANNSLDFDAIFKDPATIGAAEKAIGDYFNYPDKYSPQVVGATSHYPEPDTLVEKMLDKLPNSVWKDKEFEVFDPTAGVGTFLKGAAKKFDKGLSDIESDYNRERHISRHITGWDSHEGLVRIMNDKVPSSNHEVKDSLKESWPGSKNGAIVFNPPYGKALEFLEKAINAPQRWVIAILPATFLIHPKKKSGMYKKIKNKMDKIVNSIELVEGTTYFKDPSFRVPLAIIFLDKEKTNNNFKFIDSIRDIDKNLDNLEFVQEIGVDKIELELKEKMKKIVKTSDNFFDHLIRWRTELKTPTGGRWLKEKRYPYYVGISYNRPKLEFFPPASAKLKYGPIVSKDLNKKRQNLGVQSREEAENCYAACGTSIMKYFLSILKFEKRLYGGPTKMVPYLDWSQKWDDEKLQKHFGFSDKEMAHIRKRVKELS